MIRLIDIAVRRERYTKTDNSLAREPGIRKGNTRVNHREHPNLISGNRMEAPLEEREDPGTKVLKHFEETKVERVGRSPG